MSLCCVCERSNSGTSAAWRHLYCSSTARYSSWAGAQAQLQASGRGRGRGSKDRDRGRDSIGRDSTSSRTAAVMPTRGCLPRLKGSLPALQVQTLGASSRGRSSSRAGVASTWSHPGLVSLQVPASRLAQSEGTMQA